MYCKRCYNKNTFLFEKILCNHENCYYCLKCAHISIFKTCQNTKNDLKFIKTKVKTNEKLTKKQKQVVKEVIDNFKVGKNVFINAVCGAGKTNIIIPIIELFINQHLNVAFVCPRVEVINEQYNKFVKIFDTKIGVITGSKKELDGSFFLMTTHQLLNYKKMFHLVIVDEFDAFPLFNDKVLRNGIIQSLIHKNFLLYLSATPVKTPRSFKTIKLSRRYHNDDLPVPVIINQDYSVINKIISNGKWLIFFPTISLLNSTIKSLNIKNYIVCHSKVNYHVNNDNNIILSTAVLERGITISNINVMILYCNHKNYSKETLIQMSGRVGRVFPHTKGQIYFCSDIISYNQLQAIKHIEQCNNG